MDFSAWIIVLCMVFSVLALSTRCVMDYSDWELTSTETVTAIERVPSSGVIRGRHNYTYHSYLVILNDGGEASVEPLEWTKVEKGDIFLKEHYRRKLDHNLTKIEYKYVGKPK